MIALLSLELVFLKQKELSVNTVIGVIKAKSESAREEQLYKCTYHVPRGRGGELLSGLNFFFFF